MNNALMILAIIPMFFIGVIVLAWLGGLIHVGVMYVLNAASMGNPWPALILVNLAGFGVPLSIRWRNKRLLLRSPHP